MEEAPKHTIGIIGLQAKRCGEIQVHLRRLEGAEVRMFSSIVETQEALKKDGVAVLVFVVGEFKNQHINNLKMLCDQNKTLTVIVVAEMVPEKLRLQLSKEGLDKVNILDTRFEIDDLGETVARALQSDGFPIRKFCRYQINAQAVMMTAKGEVIHANVINVSKGGAKIQIYDENISVTELNKTIVSVEIDATSSMRHVQAEVMWANPKEMTLGLRFVEAVASTTTDKKTA